MINKTVTALMASLLTAACFAQDGPSYERLLTAKPVEQSQTKKAVWRSLATRSGLPSFRPDPLKFPGFLWTREVEAGSFVPGYSKEVCPPEKKGGLYFQIEEVYIRPELQHARAFNAENLDPRDIDFAYSRDLSTRFELGYLCSTGELGYRARYWHFSSESSPVAGNDSNGLIATDAIAILAGGGVEDVDTISVLHKIELDVFDLEATKALGSHLVASGGVRVVDMDQTYSAATDEGNLDSKLKFFGIGPTAAVEGKLAIGESPFALFGSARGSGLFGEKRLRSGNFTNNVNGGANIDDSDTDFVLNADLKAGLEFQPGYRNCFFARVGVEYQWWNDIGNLRDISDPAVDDNFPAGVTSTLGQYGGDIGFFGYTFSAGLNF